MADAARLSSHRCARGRGPQANGKDGNGLHASHPPTDAPEAIRQNAAGIILVHNHPSGDPTPSPDDLHLTAEALAVGRLLDIQVLDHIVVSRDSWVSLRKRGVSFDRAGSRGGTLASASVT